MTSFALNQRRRFIRGLIRLLAFRLVAQVRFEGLGEIPRRGSLLLIVNHTNAFDPILVMGALAERLVVPLSKYENLRHPLYGWFLRLYAPIPLRRGRVDRVALSASLAVLRAGGALVLAPEGTRSPALRRGLPGLAYLALASGASVLPVGISGMQNWQGIFRGRRARVTMRFGRVFRCRLPAEAKPTGQRRQAFLRQFTDESMHQLARLLSPELRGIYADCARAKTKTLEFLTQKGGSCAAS